MTHINPKGWSILIVETSGLNNLRGGGGGGIKFQNFPLTNFNPF